MVNFTKAKLSDIADVIDSRHETPKYSESGYPMVRVTDIKQGFLKTEGCLKVSEKIYEYFSSKHKSKKGDLVFSRVGSEGIVSLVNSNAPFCLGQNTAFIIPKNNNNFLYYWLSSPIGRYQIKTKTTGATQRTISLESIKGLNLEIPDLLTQNKISSVLTTYDDLIENNEKRIKTLEEMAQLLYTEWFVKFNFPGHEQIKMVDSGTEHGMIPEGWNIRNVESLIKRVTIGKRYDNKSVYEVGKVPVLDQGKSGFIGYHNDDPGVKASIQKPIIVFANHTCYQNIVVYPISAIQNVLPFVPKDDRDIFWLHWATKDLIKLNDYKGHWPEFMSKRLIVPSVNLTKVFGKLIKEYVETKYKLELENSNLSKIRDLLIPQLVTGKREIKV